VDLSVGSVFARRFRIERRLGGGAMGTVYEATHVDTDRRRALKVMRAELVGNEDMRRRFQQEAKIAAHVDSEFIVDVVDAGIDDETGLPFMVCELLEGEELAARLERGPLEVEAALTVLGQVAKALDKSHAASVVHRDLKPENIFLSRHGSGERVKVLDFGIAKIVSESALGKTRNLGTPLCMAPEQFSSQARLSPQTDLYAFGLLAFSVLAGKSYWHDDAKASTSLLEFAKKVMGAPTVPASQVAARYGVRLPSGFDAWFARATARAQADRFATASEAMTALEAAAGSSEASSRIDEATPAPALPSTTVVVEPPPSVATEPPSMQTVIADSGSVEIESSVSNAPSSVATVSMTPQAPGTRAPAAQYSNGSTLAMAMPSESKSPPSVSNESVEAPSRRRTVIAVACLALVGCVALAMRMVRGAPRSAASSTAVVGDAPAVKSDAPPRSPATGGTPSAPAPAASVSAAPSAATSASAAPEATATTSARVPPVAAPPRPKPPGRVDLLREEL
jgi:serine/threonine-protein kinase